MIRRRRNVGRLLFGAAVIAAALAPITGTRAEESTRGQPEAAAGLASSVSFPSLTSNSISDIELVDSVQRVFFSATAENGVGVLGYNRSYVGTVPLARPGAMSVGPDGLYVVAKDIGSIVRINPSSLATTTVVSGLNQPLGLTYTAGNLYTTVVTGAAWWDRNIIRIEPSTGATSIVATPNFTGPAEMGNMVDPSPVPGILFGSYADGSSPSGMNRMNPNDSADYKHIHDSFTCATTLDNGELLLGRFGGSFASVNTTTLVESSTSWMLAAARGCATGGGAVALTAGSSYGDYGPTTIKLYDQKRPGRAIRGYRIDGIDPVSGLTKMTKNGSLVVLVANSLGHPTIFFLPGVTMGGVVPSAPGVGATRGSAPQVGVATAPARVATAPAGWSAPVVTTSADAWLIDTPNQHTYVASAAQDLINVFDTAGAPIAAIVNIAQPVAMTICGGNVYAGLRGTGDIVRINRGTWTTTVVASAVDRVATLMCAGTTLYAAALPVPSAAWLGAVLRRIDPIAQTTTVVASAANTTLWSRYGTSSALIGLSYTSSFVRHETSGDAETSGGWVSLLNTPAPIQPLHLSADGTKFLDYSGYRYDTSTLNPDGFHFTGTNAVLSQTSPAYVAIRPAGDNTISIIDGNNPAAVIRQFSITPAFELKDLEFAPGTRTLFVLLRRLSDNYYFVAPLPDIITGTSDTGTTAESVSDVADELVVGAPTAEMELALPKAGSSAIAPPTGAITAALVLPAIPAMSADPPTRSASTASGETTAAPIETSSPPDGSASVGASTTAASLGTPSQTAPTSAPAGSPTTTLKAPSVSRPAVTPNAATPNAFSRVAVKPNAVKPTSAKAAPARRIVSVPTVARRRRPATAATLPQTPVAPRISVS